MSPILLLLWCLVITESTELEDDRKNWFNRIQKYELIDVNLDAFTSNRIIEFDAFNNHYKVQLIVNEDASPIVLQPNEDGTVTEVAADESCYYHGKVLNADSSIVAVSACEGEGFRGRIHAFGDKLFIHPKSFYDAPYEESSLSDEHLVYKSSDYDSAEAEELREEPPPPEAISEALHNPTRRRLSSAGQVELLTLIDESWVDYLGSVSSAKSYFQGVVSDASALYTYNNLPSDIEVSIKYRYAVFDSTSSCSSLTACKKVAKSYMSKYSGFDYGFFFKHYSGGGLSDTSTICMDGYTFGVSLTKQDRDVCAKHLAHELGHCLMAYASPSTHDPDNGWIMDPGGSGDTWSSRSIGLLQEMKDRGRWSCLKSSGMSGSVSYGDYEDRTGGYSSGSNTGSDTGSDTGSSGSSSSGSSCIKFYNFGSSASSLNGYWSKSGSTYSHDSSSKYISYTGSYWRVNGAWSYGWCDRSDILDCDGDWTNGDSGRIRTSTSCANMFSYPECFDDYENGMCFYIDSEASSDLYELVSDEGCFNDAPVWRYIDNDADRMYYLHYNDDAAWVITDGELSVDGEYTCAEQNLYDCIQGHWQQEVIIDEDQAVREVVDGMRIEACGFAVNTGEEQKKSVVIPLVITVVIVLVIGLIVCVGFMFYRHGAQQKMKRVECKDESEDEAQDVGDTQEITVTTTMNGN